MPVSSPAVTVMTLNVEPGGWAPSSAIPASPSTSPVRGSIAATLPKRPASAFWAAAEILVSIDARTARAGRGRVRASTRLPAESVPPGVPRRRVSSTRCSPETPTRALAGKPCWTSATRRAPSASPSSPVMPVWEPTWVWAPSRSASVRPLRASSGARRGARVTRCRRSPSRSPGNVSSADQRTRGGSPPTGMRTSPFTRPKARVRACTGNRQTSPSLSGFPAEIRVVVPVSVAVR